MILNIDVHLRFYVKVLSGLVEPPAKTERTEKVLRIYHTVAI